MNGRLSHLKYVLRQIKRVVTGRSITKNKIRKFLEEEGFTYRTVLGVNEVPDGIYDSGLLWVVVRKMSVEIEVNSGPRWCRVGTNHWHYVDFFDRDWVDFVREFRTKRRALEALVCLEMI